MTCPACKQPLDAIDRRAGYSCPECGSTVHRECTRRPCGCIDVNELHEVALYFVAWCRTARLSPLPVGQAAWRLFEEEMS